MRLVAATQNKHKLEEIYAIIKDYDIELLSQAEVGLDLDVVEDGDTCEANSFIKADAICKACGEAAIADDTGLFVDALGGDPGVMTARYAGEDCSEADNRKKLLANLKGVPFEKRTATFVTVMTIVYPDGSKLVARGECPGYIAEEELGDRGFGYDSVFIPAESDKTFAQLPVEFKNSVSHRARALAKLRELL